MPKQSGAQKGAYKTYAICRTDGSDWRDCPEGSTLEDAKAGAFALNRQCAQQGIYHHGAPSEYEVRIITRETA